MPGRKTAAKLDPQCVSHSARSERCGRRQRPADGEVRGDLRKIEERDHIIVISAGSAPEQSTGTVRQAVAWGEPRRRGDIRGRRPGADLRSSRD